MVGLWVYKMKKEALITGGAMRIGFEVARIILFVASNSAINGSVIAASSGQKET